MKELHRRVIAIPMKCRRRGRRDHRLAIDIEYRGCFVPKGEDEGFLQSPRVNHGVHIESIEAEEDFAEMDTIHVQPEVSSIGRAHDPEAAQFL